MTILDKIIAFKKKEIAKIKADFSAAKIGYDAINQALEEKYI